MMRAVEVNRNGRMVTFSQFFNLQLNFLHQKFLPATIATVGSMHTTVLLVST
jgi:hypothetical protein